MLFLKGNSFALQCILVGSACSTLSLALSPDDWSKMHPGFENHDASTCYANSMLQVFAHTGPFASAVQQASDDHLRRHPLAEKLRDVFDTIKDTKRDVKDKSGGFKIDPKVIWDTIDLKKENGKYVQDDTDVVLRAFESRLPALTSNFYQSALQSKISFTDPAHASTKVEAATSFELSLDKRATLNEALDHYVREESLTGDNKVMNSATKNKEDAKKQLKILEAAPILRFVFKRKIFNTFSKVFNKLDNAISFPAELTLDPYMVTAPAKPLKYHLHSVVVHTGSATDGHYYTFIRNATTKKWFQFNDSFVTASTATEAINDNFDKVTMLQYVSEEMWKKFESNLAADQVSAYWTAKPLVAQAPAPAATTTPAAAPSTGSFWTSLFPTSSASTMSAASSAVTAVAVCLSVLALTLAF